MSSSLSFIEQSRLAVPSKEVGVVSGSFDKFYMNGLTPEKLFGAGTDPFQGSWGTTDIQLPRRDEILSTKFGGNARAIEGYMRLLNDSQVVSSFDKFISEITQRPISIQPASTSAKDEYVAEFVRQALFKLGMTGKQSTSKSTIAYNSDGYNQITRGLAESYILGIAGAGITWVKSGKHILPVDVQLVDPRRIEITLNERGEVVPKLTVWEKGYLGVQLPARTFVLHRHWSNVSYQDSWGQGLGRQLYPLVEFRRNLMAMWLQYCDKNTTPNVVVNYPLGISKQDHEKIFETVKTFGQQTVALFPEGVNAQYLVPSSSAPQVYQTLIQYLDQQISWLITGEKDPSQSGQVTGSIPQQDRLADSVRVKKAKAFNDNLETTINNTLIRWMVELNFGFDVTPPKVQRNFSDLNDRNNKQAILGQISMLKGLGYVVNDLDWLKEQLDIPSLSFDPQVAQAAEGLPSESDNAEGGGSPAEADAEVDGVGGGAPAEGFSERKFSFADSSDSTDGNVKLKVAAEVLDIDPNIMMQALGLTSMDDLVNIDQLVDDFLDESTEDPVEQIKSKYKEDTPEGNEYYYELSSNLQTTNEDPAEMKDNITSQEHVSQEIAKNLRGTPRLIGFDQLTSTVTPFEQSRLNLYITDETPVYEILAAMRDTLRDINQSQSRDIKAEMSRDQWDRWSTIDAKVQSISGRYQEEDLRYEALVLKEILREFEKTIHQGYKENTLIYEDRLGYVQN